VEGEVTARGAPASSCNLDRNLHFVDHLLSLTFSVTSRAY